MTRQTRFYIELTSGSPHGPFTKTELMAWLQQQTSVTDVKFFKVDSDGPHPVSLSYLFPGYSHDGRPSTKAVGQPRKPFRVGSFTLLVLLATVVLPAFGLWSVGLSGLARVWIWMAFVIDLIVLWGQFLEDNRRAEIVHPRHRKVLWQALVYWLPLLAAIAPGVVLVATFDNLIVGLIRTMEVKSLGVVDQSETILASKIAEFEEKTYRWWYLPDWPRKTFDGVVRSSLQSVGDGIPQTRSAARWFWGMVYMFLSAAQTISWVFISFVALRSFFWIWTRRFLRSGGKLSFRLAAYES